MPPRFSGAVLVSCVIALTLFPALEAQTSVTTSTTLGQSKACANHYCQNGGLCIPYIGMFYTCSCQPGFTGEFCERKDGSGTPFVNARTTMRLNCTFWGIKGHFGTFWNMLGQFGRLLDEFGAFTDLFF